MQVVYKELEQCQCIHSPKDRLSIWILFTFLHTPAGIVRAIATRSRVSHFVMRLRNISNYTHVITGSIIAIHLSLLSSGPLANQKIRVYSSFSIYNYSGAGHQLIQGGNDIWDGIGMARNGESKYSAISWVFSLPHFFCSFLSPRPEMWNSSCQWEVEVEWNNHFTESLGSGPTTCHRPSQILRSLVLWGPR